MNRPPPITSIKDTPIRLAEVGKIKIGGKGEERPTKAGGTFRLPVKYDHFVVTGLEREGGKGDFIADPEVMDIIGENPKELDVILLHDDPEMNLQSKLSLYVKGKQWCVGNGEQGYRRNKDQEVKGVEQWDEMECPCNLKTGEKARCKATFVLSVMLPQSPKVGGVYKFRSTSEISLINLRSSMAFILGATNGILAGIPLKLVLQPQTVTPKGMITKVYVVNLLFPGLIPQLTSVAAEIAEQRKVGYQQTLKLRQQLDRLLLAPPLCETDEDMADEFYPEEGAIEGEIVDDETTPAVDFPRADEPEPGPEEPQEEEPPPPAEAPPEQDNGEAPAQPDPDTISDQQIKCIHALHNQSSKTTTREQSEKNLKTLIYNLVLKPPGEKANPNPDTGYSLKILTKAQASLVIEKLKEYEQAGRALGLDNDTSQVGLGPSPAEQAEQADGATSAFSGAEQASSPEPSITESPAPPDPVKDAILAWISDALSGRNAAVAQGSANVLCKAFLSTYGYATLSEATADELEQFKAGVITKARPVPPSNPSKSTRGAQQDDLF